MFTDEYWITVREIIREEIAASKEVKIPIKMYTRDEAKKVLNVSTATLDRILQRRDLPSTKVGAKVLIKEDDLNKYLLIHRR